MISSIKGQIQKLIGLQETYPTVFKEVTKYAKILNKDTKYLAAEIDIIMPSFNRLSILKRAIKHLYETTEVKFNLIIVDNNSNNETKQYLKSLKKKNLKVIFSHKNLGGSGSRMEALKYASSELVAFVDNDIFPMPFYFENLIRTLRENPNVSAVQSKVVFPNRLIQVNRPTYKIEGDWIEFYDKDIDKMYADPSTEISEELNWMPSGATIWRRSVFKKETFDPDFNTSYEDNDFTFTLKKKGYKFLNNHKAICLHLSSQFTPSSNSQVYTEARFGNKVVMQSLKQFKKKHGLFLAFGNKEKFVEFMGYKSAKELEETIRQ